MRHISITTKRAWLHGSPNGFRSRRHRIQSSGDYKNPPPPGEHAGLLRYHRERSGDVGEIPRHLRAPVGRALVEELGRQGYAPLAAAIGARHGHVLVELPDDLRAIYRILGEAKSASAHAARPEITGGLWAARGGPKPVDNERHYVNAYWYVLEDQGPTASSWSTWEGEYNDPLNPNPRVVARWEQLTRKRYGAHQRMTSGPPLRCDPA
ncbi:MAG TPA: hypothetical protein VK324_18015 [Tepidisphaeraceae bacterium]|nr:hypothetical protein [Tepidisphaeraceae bacterium]